MSKPASSALICPATPADAPAIAVLLRAAELPHEDFAPHLKHFLVTRDGAGQVVGAVGAEVCGAEALLRSLVVAPAQRGAGFGGRLVDELQRAAAAWGVRRWWLLTTTAEAFFAARGFRVVARREAPEAIRATGQFSGGICRSAICMTRGGGKKWSRADPGAERERGGVAASPRGGRPCHERDGQRLEAWLYRIARTTLIDFYRRQRPGVELPENLVDQAAEPADEVTVAMARSLRYFLEELPEAYREPVRLAEFEGLPLAKIALRMNLSLTAVKSRVRRGRAMLKRKLQDCCRLEFDRMGKIIGYERRKKCAC